VRCTGALCAKTATDCRAFAGVLAEHQACAYKALGFDPMTEHQRRYVMHWLKAAISGWQDRDGVLRELKQWPYEHRILLPRDLTLR
jgi:hypothetical protein